MKKICIGLMAILLLTSCAKSKVINGVVYQPYGFLNEETVKDSTIKYQPSFIAICSSIIFVELVIPTVYIVGYELYEPVTKK